MDDLVTDVGVFSEQVEPDEQIALTIHVDKQHHNHNWYHRIRSSSDLERYIHETDNAICQTLFSPSRFIVDGSLDQNATLMLVNHWYKPSHDMKSSWKKKRHALNARSEKAVGKIYIQCLYITVPKQGEHIPYTMDEAIEGLNIKRFHATLWQSGYLSQLDENTMVRACAHTCKMHVYQPFR